MILSANGQTYPVNIEGTPVLLARVDGEVYAVADACGDSPLPLRFGTLESASLRCAFHGCLYDVRTGKRLDAGGQGDRVAVFPVKEEHGRILVATGVRPAAPQQG